MTGTPEWYHFSFQAHIGAIAMPNFKTMNHGDLYALRDSLAPIDPRQQQIAPYEHRAFAREWTQESPVLGPLSLTFAIPAYAAAKATGLQQARTPPSWDQVFQGYAGIYDGLKSITTKRNQS